MFPLKAEFGSVARSLNTRLIGKAKRFPGGVRFDTSASKAAPVPVQESDNLLLPVSVRQVKNRRGSVVARASLVGNANVQAERKSKRRPLGLKLRVVMQLLNSPSL